MSISKVNLGFLPINRGTYSSSATYYKDNIVLYNGSSYICTKDPGSGTTPQGITGEVPYVSLPDVPNTHWAIFVNNQGGPVEGIYDISANHITDNVPKIYTSLSSALNDVPNAKRQGGMIVTFILEITPAQYSVVKTENVAEIPAQGHQLSTAPAIESGTYTLSQLSAFTDMPTLSLNQSVTYYVEVSGESTTYTKWVITLVQSSDNKYVQYRYMGTDVATAATFTKVANWQGVDDEPTAGSDNLVKSGGIVSKYGDNIQKTLIDSTETQRRFKLFIAIHLDENKPNCLICSDVIVPQSKIMYVKLTSQMPSNPSSTTYDVKSIGDISSTYQGEGKSKTFNFELTTEEAASARYLLFYTSELTGTCQLNINLRSGLFLLENDVNNDIEDINIHLEQTDDAIININEYIDNIETAVTKTKKVSVDIGSIVGTGGLQESQIGQPIVISGNANSYKTYKINCEAGDVFDVTTTRTTSASYYAYAFADSSNNTLVLYRDNQTGVIKWENVIAPENAKYLYVTAGKITGGRWYSAVDQIISENLLGQAVDAFFDKKNYDKIISDGKEAIGNAVAKVMSYNGDKKFLNFAFITDTHYGNPYRISSYNLEIFKELGDSGWVDAVIHGGDIFDAYNSSLEDSTKKGEYVMRKIGNINMPVIVSRGNHDLNNHYKNKADLSNLDWDNVTYYEYDALNNVYVQVTEEQWDGVTPLYYGENDSSQFMLNSMFFALFQNRLRYYTNVHFDSTNPYGEYFYIDFDKEKIRIINTCAFNIEHPNNTNWYGKQLKFIAEEAFNLSQKEVPSDWGIVIISHAYQYSDVKLYDIIDAFKQGTSISETSDGISYSFDYSSQGNGTFIAFIHGHEHADNYNNDFGFNSIGVIHGYSSVNSVGVNNFSFDIFTIDTTTKTIYETRVGRGSDREYSYGTTNQQIIT